jgi:hypothetical protein
MKESLKMALVIKQKTEDTIEYIPILERESEAPATFTLKRIPQRAFAKLEDQLARVYNDQSIGLSTATFNYNVVKLSLVDWANINDEYERPITPEKTKEGVFKDDYINMIPQAVINELAEVAAGITRDSNQIELFKSIGSPEAVAEQLKAFKQNQSDGADGEVEEAEPPKRKSAGTRKKAPTK